MRMKSPRIPPIEPKDWTAEQNKMLGEDISDVPINLVKEGKVTNVLKTFGRYPELFKAWMGFGRHIMFNSSLEPRQREIAILRIGWLCQCGYEFGRHIIRGQDAGLSESEIKAVAQGAEAGNWSASEQALIKAADELHWDAFVGDTTYAELQKHFSEKQILDIIFTIGQYNLVSMALNTAGVQLEEDENIPEYKSFVGE